MLQLLNLFYQTRYFFLCYTSYIVVEVTFFVCPFNPVFLAYKFYFVEYFIFFLYQWNQFCYHYIPPVQHNLSMTLKRSGIYTLSKIINSQTIRKIYIDIIQLYTEKEKV